MPYERDATTWSRFINNFARLKDRFPIYPRRVTKIIILGVKSDGTLVDIHDDDGYPQLQIPGIPRVQHAYHTPATNASAIVTVTDTRWEVVGIQASMICAVAVADRAFTVSIEEAALDTLPNANVSFVSTAVSLQSGEDGQIFMGSSTAHTANDNGTVTQVADENPLPVTLENNSMIIAAATNKNAGDRLHLRVKYRKLE